MYDIITFGSAAQDIHLKSKAFKVLKDNKDFITGEGICLNLGSKVDIEDIVFTTGGGGTNTAATFAKQGFKTAFCGAIGVDLAGLEIIRELKQLRVDTKFIVKNKEKHTNHSIIISSSEQLKDRTILVYRGASELIDIENINFKKLKTKWIYSAPLTGLLCDNFYKIIDFAKDNNIKIAVNPSKQQLSLPENILKDIFSKIDILFLNKEEASFLTKISFDKEENILKKISEICPGIVVITKGGNGVIVTDGKYIYSAGTNLNIKIIDTTGAGDSFASGFLSNYIKYKNDTSASLSVCIEKAIQLGIANSEANIAEVGAKTGLLEKDSKFDKVEVLKQNL